MDFEEMFEEGFDPENAGAQQSADMFMFGMDEKEVEELKQNRDSVVFLIDCHKSMHDKNPHNGADQSSNISQVLKACLSFMKTKIITSDNDKIGIVLYGCKTTSNSLNFNNIHVFQKLDSPDAATIKNLEKKTVNFTTEFGFAAKEGQTPLFEALWICHQEFKSVEKQSFNKRIFLFTNEDNPGNANDKNMAQQRANDLASLEVDIELFPLPKPIQQKATFDVKKFYANIITFDEEEQFSEMLGIEGTQSRITELMKRIRQKEFRKRTQGKCLFSLTPKAQVGLCFYTQIMPAKKPGAAKVNAINNKQLKSTQRYICQETGSVLYQNQIGHFYPVGGEKVPMSQEDVKQIKFFDKMGMKLMGFKPRSALKVFHNIKHSYFIYPDEKRITGSSQVVDALVKEMNATQKIAIVRFIPRENSQVRFCALVPQEEKFDEEDGFQTPPGFQLIFLPYADDIRDINSIFDAAGFPTDNADEEENVIENLSKQEKDAAKLLVKNLTIDFNSRNFENPTIQKFYAGLQALALNEPEPEHVEDLLEPDYKGMKKFDPIVQKFKDAFFDGDAMDPVCAGLVKGRGRGRGGASQTSARGGRGRATPNSTQDAPIPAAKGRGRGAAAKYIKEESDEDEKEIPLPTQDSKKRKNPPAKIEKKNGNKKRKVNDESDDDFDAEDLADFIVDDKPKRGGKSSQPASASKGSAKKGKNQVSELDKKFRDLNISGKLGTLTVNELKEFLTVKNLPNKGAKAFLIDVIGEYFETSMDM